MKKIVIYGCGYRFKQIVERIKFNEVEVVACCDKNLNSAKVAMSLIESLGGGEGKHALPGNISQFDFDYVLICSDDYSEEMKTFLLERGVLDCKICIAESNTANIARLKFMEERSNVSALSIILNGYISPHIVINEGVYSRIDRRMSGFDIKMQFDYVRVSTLELIADQIYKHNIAGAVAELGVFQGEFAALINDVFSDRAFYLFDTFEGFSNTDLVYDVLNDWIDENRIANAGYVSFDGLKNTSVELVLSKMPHRNRCLAIKGKFPDTVVSIPNEEHFAFVHLDADLYLPMYEGLKFFFPRMSIGGYIMIHDYYDNMVQGTREAVEKFIGENALSIVPVSDSGGSCIIVKQQ